jgi:putative flavoprotein involved in K+ transport
MTIEHIETAIIGAGQAGLATAYHLQRRGQPCLILDGNRRVGDNWRAQWDSLRLYSPAGYDGLPGLPFPAP